MGVGSENRLWRRHGRAWPLKVYVLGLVALVVAAAAANAVYQRSAAAQDARRSATADADFAADVAARDLSESIALVLTTVATTAATPGLEAVFAAPTPCSLAFGGSGSFVAGHIDVVALDGTVGCSSLEVTSSPLYAGAAWLTTGAGEPMVTGPVVDVRTGKQVMVVTAPVADTGMVVAFLELEALGPALASSFGGPHQLEFVVTTADGTVALARSHDPTRWVAEPLAGTSFTATPGQTPERDVDGTSRLYGQATVETLGWTVFAGADESDVLAAATRISNRQIAITVVGLVLLLAAAWILHRRVARPIAELGGAVRAATDRASQSDPISVSGPAEIARLVDDFNDLIAAARRERQLADRLRQAERLESVGQLAGGIAHDFNNLIGVITNYAAFVEQETADQPRVQADVAEIQAAGERAARLTKQLLTFARSESIRTESLDLNAVVADINKLLSRAIGEHIELTVRLAADPQIIECDRGQLEQVLVNLAVNARDAMPGGGTLTIETSAVELDEGYARLHPGATPGRYVQLAVSDTGVGMSADVADRVFEPFFTTKAKGEGTGLGLAIVYGIVTGTGGTMSVYSEEGIGTTFRLYFPASEPAAGATETEQDAPARGNGETILVVEDELAVLELTSRILREEGYTVLPAATAEQALRLATDHDFQLLLTDSVMPRMSGLTLAEQIDQMRPGRPVLFMSGYSGGVVGPKGVLHPGSVLIEKPFTRRSLSDSVRGALTTPPSKPTPDTT